MFFRSNHLLNNLNKHVGIWNKNYGIISFFLTITSYHEQNDLKINERSNLENFVTTDFTDEGFFLLKLSKYNY